MVMGYMYVHMFVNYKKGVFRMAHGQIGDSL